MSSLELYEELRQIAQLEFADVVTLAEIARLDSGVPRKLRLRVVDGSMAINDSFTNNASKPAKRKCPEEIQTPTVM
jgi:hypothetical protein